MSELFVFGELGLRHILDPRGLDHVLFVIALACGYRAREWRALLWVASAFTLGHSVTLALAVTGLVVFPAPIIELLIPVTIVVTGVHGMLVAPRVTGKERWIRPAMAGAFGLIHGAGFANYLRSMFVDDVTVPLLGFNLGLELGQLVVIAAALAAFALADAWLARVRLRGVAPVRVRGLAVSLAVTLVAMVWTVERIPW